MKKLIVIICLTFIADYSFAQLDTLYPSPPQQIGRKNVLVVDSGGLKSAQMFVAPIYGDTATANTANPYTRSYVGSVIYTQDKQAYWFRQDVPRKWVLMGSSNGNNNTDTIYTEIPIAVKIDSLGRHIIYFLRPNGLYGGGIVTVDSCMTIDVTPPIIVVNYKQYTGRQTTGIVIQPADPSLPRIDRVVMDTNLNIIVIEGMPSSTPVPPEFNSFSQVSLAEIPVGADITCLGNAEIIFDGVADFAGQYTLTTAGTGVTDFTNTANPYHLTQASYTVTYSNGYQIIYTKPSGTDTVKATSVLKGFVVVVGTYPNTNQISGQWFNGSTAVSNQLLLNSYFNVNDSNNYQIFSPQLSAWSWPGGTVYNKLVLTFGGNDNSGANGVYLDWLQIQTGIGNAANKQYQDSSSIVAGFLTDWYNGVPITRQSVGGGGTVTADNGLNISSGSNVQLGGTLLKQTIIDAGATQTAGLVITGQDDNRSPFVVSTTGTQPSSADNIAGTFVADVVHNSGGENIGIRSTATSGDGVGKGVEATGDYVGVVGTSDTYGIWGISTSGYGILGTSTNGLSGVFQVTPSSTSTVVPVINIIRSSSGTPANGIGGSLDFRNQNVTNSDNISNQLISKWTNATFASRDAEFSITGVDNAVTSTWLKLDGSFGYLYSDTIATRAYARSVGGGGGGGNTIYTGDGSFPEERVIDINGNALRIINGSNGNQMVISPTHSTYTSTDNIADAGLTTQGIYTENNVFNALFADDGVKATEIFQRVDTLTHTSYTNIISDALRFHKSGDNDTPPDYFFQINDGTDDLYTIDITGMNPVHTFTGNVIFNNTARLKGYTVSTLPAGVQGDMAYVTDALLPSFLVTVAGSGSVVTPVFYDGSSWKAY